MYRFLRISMTIVLRANPFWDKNASRLHWEKFGNKISDAFKGVIGILVYWHISTGILTRIPCYPRRNTLWNVSIYKDPNDSLKRVVYVAECFQRSESKVGVGFTEKKVLPFPFTLNGIRSWWQFSFRFWSKWKSISFKIEKKTVTTIISHSMWKEMEV